MFKFILVSLLLSGCGGSSDPMLYRKASPNTAPFIQKGEVWSDFGMESTPIVWNGELLYVASIIDSGARIRIYRQSDKALLSDTLINIVFISALVENGTLYVFGATNSARNGSQTISMISTTDLTTWTPAVVVYTAPSGTLVYNTSVAPDATGWVMAYEICVPNTVCFNVRFLHSDNMVSWSPVGSVYEINYYTACPTIRYVDGWYYMFYLSHYRENEGYHATNVSRSQNLRDWEFSSITVLSPLDGDHAGNASDMDFVEHDGVRIIYANNSQFGIVVPNSGTREALFEGTISQFVSLFFTSMP